MHVTPMNYEVDDAQINPDAVSHEDLLVCMAGLVEELYRQGKLKTDARALHQACRASRGSSITRDSVSGFA